MQFLLPSLSCLLRHHPEGGGFRRDDVPFPVSRPIGLTRLLILNARHEPGAQALAGSPPLPGPARAFLREGVPQLVDPGVDTCLLPERSLAQDRPAGTTGRGGWLRSSGYRCQDWVGRNLTS